MNYQERLKQKYISMQFPFIAVKFMQRSYDTAAMLQVKVN